MVENVLVRGSAGSLPPPRVACLILGQDALERKKCVEALAVSLPAAFILPDCSNIEQAIGIAEEAGCDWLLPIRAHDRLSGDIGPVLRGALADRPPPIIFWNSDQIIDGERCNPFIKPEWDDVLLRDWDLLGGAALIALPQAKRALGSCMMAGADEFGVSQLMLALLSSGMGWRPRHIPLILSHHSEGRPFVEEKLRLELLVASGFVRQATNEAWPSVSIIIPTRDQSVMLASCIASVDRSNYPGDIELMIVDNDSLEPETKNLFDRLKGSHDAKVISFSGEFNFAAMMNLAAGQATGEYLCLLNNDVEALDGNWLKELVCEALAPEVAAVGARLLYPDGTIQHVGIAVGLGGAAGHVEKGANPQDPQFANWHSARRRVSAVTAACMVVKHSKFVAVGGMDEQNFAVDFNDVDLCLKFENQGWLNIIVPQATLVHHESKSRGKIRSPEQRPRFERELAALRERWGTQSYHDPWHSPLFRRDSERCLLKF